VYDCDEFPYGTTQEGGARVGNAQPHLKYISYSHNRVQGGDLKNFFARRLGSPIAGNGCSVRDGEPFLVIPLTPSIAIDWVNQPGVQLVERLVPTQYICSAQRRSGLNPLP